MGVVDLVLNPSERTQQYTLWDTGRIDPFGGALPVTDAPSFIDTAGSKPCRALHITDWNGPSGYVFTDRGGFYAFGSAVPPGPSETPHIMPGVPFKGKIAGGVQADSGALYADFAWNPDNSGQGYVCTLYGEILHFGGATPPIRAGTLWGQPYAKRFHMQFQPFKRSVILDYFGGRNQDWPFLQLPTDGYYNLSRDWARDMVVTDWGDPSPVRNPSGYLLTADGLVWEWGPTKPQDAFGGPSGGQVGTQVGLGLIKASDPLTLVQAASLGQVVPYQSSTPPTVVAGGSGQQPPAVVLNTTRPDLTWSYSDPQGDRQAEWQLVVWPQSYVDVTNMTDPRLNRDAATISLVGTDPTTRGVPSPVDMDNGYYRMYIRAKDTSSKFSAYSNRGWSQAVPELPAPTDLLATVDGFQVNLLLTAASPAAGQLALFERSADQGLTWRPVRGAENVPLLTVTAAVDYDVPLGLSVTYRGRIFANVPRTIGPPSPERTVTAESYVYVITSCDDPTLGGEFAVTELDWSRTRSAGVFEPLGAEYPIVITDGQVRARQAEMVVKTWTREESDRLAGVLSLGSTIVVRDQFGEVLYCRVVGDWQTQLLQAAPGKGEETGLRHSHVHNVTLVEVAQPLPVPAEDV